jgi:CRP/FNR family transcriptional regulator
MSISAFLQHIFLFDSLSTEQLEAIAGFATVRTLAKGEHLFHEEQKASAFFVVKTGRLKIYRVSPEGAEHILHIQNPFDLIAEAAIFDVGKYPANCQALEDSVIIRISKSEFRDFIMKNPEIAFKIMNSYSKRLRQFVATIEDLTFMNIRSRLASFLLKQSEAQPDGRRVATIQLSKKDLAAMLGTIPETLSRSLQFLKKEGLICENGDEIAILQPKKLQELIHLA